MTTDPMSVEMERSSSTESATTEELVTCHPGMPTEMESSSSAAAVATEGHQRTSFEMETASSTAAMALVLSLSPAQNIRSANK